MDKKLIEELKDQNFKVAMTQIKWGIKEPSEEIILDYLNKKRKGML